MPKITEISKKDREDIHQECWSKAIQITRSADHAPAGFGICSSCTHMRSARTKYAVVRAFCLPMQLSLTNEHPIQECSTYTERGGLSIDEMYSMAYYIDLKRPIGFEPEDTQK